MAKIDEVLVATSELQVSVAAATAKIDELRNSGASEAQLQQVLDGIKTAKASLDAAVTPPTP